MNMIRQASFHFIFLITVLLFLSPQAEAYQEVDVSRSGTISGRITLQGQIPPPRIFSLSIYPYGSFCKKISDGKGYVLLRDFVASDSGGLWDTVIAVQKAEKGKPFPLIQKEFVATDCMFHPTDVAAREQFFFDKEGRMHHGHPNVAILENHQLISIINQDLIVHNEVFQKEWGNIS